MSDTFIVSVDDHSAGDLNENEDDEEEGLIEEEGSMEDGNNDDEGKTFCSKKKILGLFCCCCCCLPIIGTAIFLAIAYTKGLGTVHYIDVTGNRSGYPVWSDDGSSIAGIEVFWDTGFVFPPNQGWTSRINPRFVLFQQDENGKREDIINKPDHAISLYYMKNISYILINYLQQPQEFRGSFVVNLDGTERETSHLSNSALGFPQDRYTAIPSRDGSIIAAIADNGTHYNVSFVDASNMNSINSTDFTANLDDTNPYFFWDKDDGTLKMTGLEKNQSLEIGFDGTVTEAFNLSCIPHPTSSGPVRESDGAHLEVSDEGDRIVVKPYDNWDSCL